MDALLLQTNLLISHLAALSGIAVGTLFSAVWEGAVLAVCVEGCLRLMPGLSAAARSAIWMNIFAMLVLLHVLPVSSHFSAQANAAELAPLHRTPFHLDLRWSVAIAAVWAALSAWRAAQLMVGAIRLHRMAGRATPIEIDAALNAILSEHSRAAELCTSTEVARPSVFGFFHPRILIPPQLRASLSDTDLQLVVRHEMEHLRRADDWSNLIQKVGLVLFPLNPVLLWVEWRLCAERELACDDRVLNASGGRKAYAVCLTRLAEYSMLHRGLSLVLGAWEKQSELVQRVHRILRKPGKSISARSAMFASAALIAGALGCAVVLSRSPQLVSFVPSGHDTAQAVLRAGPAADFDSADMNMRPEVGVTQPGSLAKFKLVKAVMPEPGFRTSSRAKRIESSALRDSVTARQILTRAESNDQSKSEPVLTRTAAQTSSQATQAWVVLTEWSDTSAQPHLVIRVDRAAQDETTQGRTTGPQASQGAADREPQPSYEAIRIANGWLIVQI
jgi:beta-lactamase regulating signal transducer with metallopeptidase domain